LSNTEKAQFGENAFAEALSDFPVIMNVSYGQRQKDIDHLVFTSNSVIMNECKNTKENFVMYYSWFLSHVVDRYADGLPIAQYYAQTYGYSIKKIIFTLTIPHLNTEPIVTKALKGLKIHVIETNKQITIEEDKEQWYALVRRQILSVINNRTSYYSPISKDEKHNLINNADRIKKTSVTNDNTNAKKRKHDLQIPHDVTKDLADLSIALAFPLGSVLKIYNEKYQEMVEKKPQMKNSFDFAVRLTRLEIKNRCRKLSNCQYCLIRTNYGCAFYRLSLKFRRLLEKAFDYCKTYKDDILRKLLREISFEFAPIHEKTIKCTRKRAYQHRLGFSTMDHDLPASDPPKAKYNQQSLDPLKELRDELDRLRKEKEWIRVGTPG
jgi:hypothetical protein